MSIAPHHRRGSAWQRPVLRDDGESHRAVGWLELFFDLIFVVIIAVLATDLEHSLSAAGLLNFAVQFLAVVWVWNAFTYYTERFESFGLDSRLFVFIAILAVAGLAVWGEHGLERNYVGFVASYLLARGLNIAMWLRAGHHEPRFGKAARGFAAGFVIALLLFGASLFVDHSWRVLLCALAVLVEIATPAITAGNQAGLPQISRDKFPERFGLFTLIVLGETVAGVIRALATANAHAQVSVQTVVAGVLGLAIGFGMWWLYFDFVARRPAKPLFSAALIWVYLHLVMLTCIVLVGVGVSLTLSDVEATSLTPMVRLLTLGGLGVTLLAIAALELTLDREDDEPTHPLVSPLVKLVVGCALAAVAVLPVSLPAMAELGVGVLALVIPATYGAIVWFRPSDRKLSRSDR